MSNAIPSASGLRLNRCPGRCCRGGTQAGLYGITALVLCALAIATSLTLIFLQPEFVPFNWRQQLLFLPSLVAISFALASIIPGKNRFGDRATDWLCAAVIVICLATMCFGFMVLAAQAIV
jgi:hypothetical protein